MKTYYRQDNVGTAKYTVSFHDGIKTHKDNSPFYDTKTFKNVVSLKLFIKTLDDNGYQLRGEYKQITNNIENRRKIKNYLLSIGCDANDYHVDKFVGQYGLLTTLLDEVTTI